MQTAGQGADALQDAGREMPATAPCSDPSRISKPRRAHCSKFPGLVSAEPLSPPARHVAVRRAAPWPGREPGGKPSDWDRRTRRQTSMAPPNLSGGTPKRLMAVPRCAVPLPWVAPPDLLASPGARLGVAGPGRSSSLHRYRKTRPSGSHDTQQTTCAATN
jgi:hypothetical protein